MIHLISQSYLRFVSFLVYLLVFAISAAAVADDELPLLAQQVIMDLNKLQEETAQADIPLSLSTRLNKRLDRVKHEVEAGVRMIWLGREAKAMSHFQRAFIHINHYQAILSEQVVVGEVSEAVTNALSPDSIGIVQIIEACSR